MTVSLRRDETKNWPGSRTISLGGEDYVVAPMLLRQTIDLADVTKRLFDARGSITPLPDNKDRAVLGSEMIKEYVEVLRLGLVRVYQDVTKDDILDLPATIEELVSAATVVMEQAGARKTNGAAGESAAASGSSASTGTSSSLN